MKQADGNMPERLRVEGATDLERRLLEAAAHEQPSPELRERMAQAIGVSPPAFGAPADTTASGTSSAPSGASGGSGSSAAMPWIAAAVLGLAVTGAIVGTRLSTRPVRQESPSSPAVPPPAVTPAPPRTVPAEIATGAESQLSTPLPLLRNRPTTTGSDLREQIALVDSARAAIVANAGQRALEALRRYQDKYPAGSFRPETAALKVEALVKLGRRAEARALAERFTSEYGGGPLADRVARIAGLAKP
jgi:hypothetical protein